MQRSAAHQRRAGGPDRPLEILLVAEGFVDVLLTRQALDAAGVDHDLWVVGDGTTATALLDRSGRFAGAQRPDLVLLGRSAATACGLAVVAAVEQDSDLRHIPVIVLGVGGRDDGTAGAIDVDDVVQVVRGISTVTPKPQRSTDAQAATGRVA